MSQADDCGARSLDPGTERQRNGSIGASGSPDGRSRKGIPFWPWLKCSQPAKAAPAHHRGRFSVRGRTVRAFRTRRSSAGYDPAVQEIELALIVVSGLGLLAIGAIRLHDHYPDRPLLLGALLGIVPGILGAVIVLVPRTDLIPDGAEPYLWLTIALATSGLAIFALSRGVARR